MKELLRDAVSVIETWWARFPRDMSASDRAVVTRMQAEIDAPEQEPIAWTGKGSLLEVSRGRNGIIVGQEFYGFDIPLYTKPQPVADLTDSDIEFIYDSLPEYGPDWINTFARAVLAAQKAKR